MIIRNVKFPISTYFWASFELLFLGIIILIVQVGTIISGVNSLFGCLPNIVLSLVLVFMDLMGHLVFYSIMIHVYKEFIVLTPNKGIIICDSVVLNSFELKNVWIVSSYLSFLECVYAGVLPGAGKTIILIKFEDGSLKEYELGITRLTSKKMKKYINKHNNK